VFAETIGFKEKFITGSESPYMADESRTVDKCVFYVEKYYSVAAIVPL